MIPERIAQIEATLNNADNVPEATRRELLELLASLKAEVASLVATNREGAQQITGRAETAVQAAVRREEQPDEAAEAVEGLASSVRDFEASHPKLVQVVDRLALVLSNMGI
jgi:DNA-binding NarL/FixJ family response regulator